MRPLATRPGITSVFALILALFVLVAASPVSASPQGQLTVTLPDGTAPRACLPRPLSFQVARLRRSSSSPRTRASLSGQVSV